MYSSASRLDAACSAMVKSNFLPQFILTHGNHLRTVVLFPVPIWKKDAVAVNKLKHKKVDCYLGALIHPYKLGWKLPIDDPSI